MSKIDDYNKDVQNWDFNREETSEFLRLLSERNLYVQGQTPLVDFYPDCKKPSKNVVGIDSQAVKVLEHIAFHVGFPNQRRLYTLVDEDTGSRTNYGVFFSLKPEDVIYFSEFDKNPLSMVYFLDSGKSNEARVQIKYESPVISRYDLDDM